MERASLDPMNADVVLNAGSLIKAADINDPAGPEAYATPANSKYWDCDYNITTGAGGTLVVYLGADSKGYFLSAKVDGASYSNYQNITQDGVTVRAYAFNVQGTQHTLKIANIGKNEQIVFSVAYAPDTNNTITAGSSYCHGKAVSGNSYQSSFTVAVPQPGLLKLTVKDDIGTSPVYVSGPGFNGFNYLSNSAPTQVVGIKKAGTYTFTVTTSAAAYDIATELTPVKETKFASKKKKARTLKAGKTASLIMTAGGKNVHWYKIKVKKTKKVRINFHTYVSNGGSGSGYFKVTMYKGSKKFIGTPMYRQGETTDKANPNNAKGKKLKKGTYYIKVESAGNATGIMTIKWK